LQNKKGPRIRQGSPQEEEALVTHIASLAPSTQHCQEVGQLAELLVFLGHAMDARKLQTLLSEVLVNQKNAEDKAGKVAEQKGAESGVAPKAVDWKWDVLRPVQS